MPKIWSWYCSPNIKEKDKYWPQLLRSNPTWQPGRAHARTKRYGSPVAHAQTPTDYDVGARHWTWKLEVGMFVDSSCRDFRVSECHFCKYRRESSKGCLGELGQKGDVWRPKTGVEHFINLGNHLTSTFRVSYHQNLSLPLKTDKSICTGLLESTVFRV